MATDASLLVQRVVYAGLRALQAGLALDLCAYLHRDEDSGPQLFLRAPELAAMDATQAFDLFGVLRDTLDLGKDGPVPLRVADFDAVAVVTRGLHSTGVHLAGRRVRALDAAELAAVGEFAAALGEVVHGVEAPTPHRSPAPPARVSVEIAGGECRAEVTVGTDGGARRGSASAWSATAAVALAALEAVDGSLRLLDSREVDAGAERVVLVLAEDGRGRRAVGSALGDGDAVNAAAVAALAAAGELAADEP